LGHDLFIRLAFRAFQFAAPRAFAIAIGLKVVGCVEPSRARAVRAERIDFAVVGSWTEIVSENPSRGGNRFRAIMSVRAGADEIDSARANHG
jgi:hypothetical protein